MRATPRAVIWYGLNSCVGNAADVDLPLGRLVDAGEHVEDRRLAGAVRTDQADQLVRLDGEIEMRHRRQAAEADRDVLRVEQSVRR